MFSAEMRNWYSVLIGAMIACGVGVGDAFHFHSFGTNADLILFMGGLAALGLHIQSVATTNAVVAGTSTAVNTTSTPTKQ